MEKLTEAQQKYKKKVDLLSGLIKANAITLEDALLLLEKDELENSKPVQQFNIRTTDNVGMAITNPNSSLPVTGTSRMTITSNGGMVFPKLQDYKHIPTSGATTTAHGSINYYTSEEPEKQETIK